MQSLAGYLSKVTSLLTVKHASRKTIAAVLAKYNIVVPEESLTVRDGVLRCSVSPLQKSQIFMHKETIIADLGQLSPQLVKAIE